MSAGVNEGLLPGVSQWRTVIKQPATPRFSYLASLRMYESLLPIYDSKRGSRVCYNLCLLSVPVCSWSWEIALLSTIASLFVCFFLSFSFLGWLPAVFCWTPFGQKMLKWAAACWKWSQFSRSLLFRHGSSESAEELIFFPFCPVQTWLGACMLTAQQCTFQVGEKWITASHAGRKLQRVTTNKQTKEMKERKLGGKQFKNVENILISIDR